MYNYQFYTRFGGFGIVLVVLVFMVTPMYYLLFLKKNQNVYRQIDTQDLILLLLIYIVQVQIHSHFVS